MGHRRQQQQQQHEAVDNMLNLFTKASYDLSVVQHRLEKEFQNIYPENANPMNLVSRVKKIQDELSSLKDQCRELLAAKQGLIDQARTTLVGNRSLLQRMQTSSGLPVTRDFDDPAYADFNQAGVFCAYCNSSFFCGCIFPSGVNRGCTICQQATKIKQDH